MYSKYPVAEVVVAMFAGPSVTLKQECHTNATLLWSEPDSCARAQ